MDTQDASYSHYFFDILDLVGTVVSDYSMLFLAYIHISVVLAIDLVLSITYTMFFAGLQSLCSDFTDQYNTDTIFKHA